MRLSCALGLALVLVACGASSAEEATTTGGLGGGSAGGNAMGGSAGGMPAASGALCEEVTASSWSCTPNNFHQPLIGFVAGSDLIFRGTVTALHATTTGIDLPDESRAVVVHVDDVLFEGGLVEVAGQDVTVQLLAAPTMAVGYQGYFFTSVWSIGQSVGVTEVAHVDPGVYPTLDSDVPGIQQLLADERLYARMDTAGAVLVGTVTAVTSLPDQGPFSEHVPIWAEATIAADCTLRGAKPATTSVAFATSLDVAWAQSPKLAVGQKGVFLLQPSPSPPGPWAVPDAIPYVVTDALDVLTIDQRSRVATLVLCPPSE